MQVIFALEIGFGSLIGLLLFNAGRREYSQQLKDISPR
jgi:hypothetical protein